MNIMFIKQCNKCLYLKFPSILNILVIIYWLVLWCRIHVFIFLIVEYKWHKICNEENKWAPLDPAMGGTCPLPFPLATPLNLLEPLPSDGIRLKSRVALILPVFISSKSVQAFWTYWQLKIMSISGNFSRVFLARQKLSLPPWVEVAQSGHRGLDQLNYPWSHSLSS